ncbi:MAG TPA: hypothetical protein VMI55_06195 [Thermoplasmata archaeon]|nr:hypothetical protein [Thermoplasmata archaeon]
MSDVPSLHSLLAGAPLEAEWDDPVHLPLAVLPCIGRIDLSSRMAFLGEP